MPADLQTRVPAKRQKEHIHRQRSAAWVFCSRRPLARCRHHCEHEGTKRRNTHSWPGEHGTRRLRYTSATLVCSKQEMQRNITPAVGAVENTRNVPKPGRSRPKPINVLDIGQACADSDRIWPGRPWLEKRQETTPGIILSEYGPILGQVRYHFDRNWSSQVGRL